MEIQSNHNAKSLEENLSREKESVSQLDNYEKELQNFGKKDKILIFNLTTLIKKLTLLLQKSKCYKIKLIKTIIILNLIIIN